MNNSYMNLPPFQRRGQQFADRFNADELFWRKLEKRRTLRRKLMPWLTEAGHQTLDQREFTRLRPPDDCIAE